MKFTNKHGDVYKLKFCREIYEHGDFGSLKTTQIPTLRKLAHNTVKARKSRGYTFAMVYKNAVPMKAVGMAICSASEPFNKEAGRQIALARLLKVMHNHKLADIDTLWELAQAYFDRPGAKDPVNEYADQAARV